MQNTVEPKTSKRKAKEKEPLVKPKRPRSAYNFFVKEERAKIVAEDKQSEGSDASNKTSFEEIGRIIGQRWRNIEADELARYKELAKADSERYQKEMKAFYNDEVALMCQGHNVNESPQPEAGCANLFAPQSGAVASASSNHQQAAAAAQSSVTSEQLMGLLLQSAAGQGQPITERTSTAAFAGNPNMRCQENSTGSAPTDSLPQMDDQIIQLLIQHQQSSSSPYTSGTIANLIQSLKSSIQHRVQKLTTELNGLLSKNAILDTIIANERLKSPQLQPGQGNGPSNIVAASSSFVGLGNMNSLATDQLLPLLQQQQQQQNIGINGLLAVLRNLATEGQRPPAPTFSTQNPLFQNNPPSSMNSGGIVAPTSNSSMPTQPGTQLADQISLLKRFLDENRES